MQTLISDTANAGGPDTPKYAPNATSSAIERLVDRRAYVNGPPHDVYAQLRAEAPVAWCPPLRPGTGGFWALTRHADVMAANPDAETFSSQRGGILLNNGPAGQIQSQLGRASLDAMINMDAPMHMQLRREHMPFFTARYIDQLKLKVEAEITRLLDEMAPLGECDLVEHLSSQLPLFTLCEILGVPPADRPKFLRWMHFLEGANNAAAEQSAGQLQVTPDLMKMMSEFQGAIGEMFAYGRDMLHKRRADPKEDLMSAIARAQLDGEVLADEYLDGSWLLIVFAGNDTTRNTISGSMKLLTEFPDQKAKLIAKPDLLPGAVNEFIRMISPVIYMRRTATKDTEIGGQKIGEGEKIAMLYGAANRDPAMFADPDRLDVERANADKHIAFGFGPHVCVGKQVAKMQLEAVYGQLLKRFPDMRYAGGIDVAPNNFVFAIRKLPVVFTPARKAA
jgi:cytochrome P450